ncbi:similar to sensor histidine kinase/response regulator [Plenodomus lingam JN3]|uniref:Similar to sensor histidine kinase/response regulator n=1 Tax=Leptosphaeria maculans (strain JN3 / isolate v23.1.3 / race Av1-4-5-6-7-8) TaxID=985895 RepID=E5R4V6_LEPMJ|nr:similar to sensor histidine kinase/response regulator [Plenodomus lingam JN3]CBX92229.1 similar to sensor histidine kinase/response regulator [Plenodomus lingam JN3]
MVAIQALEPQTCIYYNLSFINLGLFHCTAGPASRLTLGSLPAEYGVLATWTRRVDMEDLLHDRGDRKKEREDMRRERDVLLLYGAAFRNIPHITDTGKHVPRPSPDSTLTALCQLTAIRLGAERAMISLLDEHRQHILAEATCHSDLSARPQASEDASNMLWLGNVSIPRNWGLCENLLALDRKEDPIIIIPDLSQDSYPYFRDDVRSKCDMRFFASVGLLSPNGTIVGSLCVFDYKPRNDLSRAEGSLLRRLATTVIEYLDTYTIKDQYKRGERFTRGLVSFADGASGLLPFENKHRRGLSSTISPVRTAPQGSSQAPNSNNQELNSSGYVASSGVTTVQGAFSGFGTTAPVQSAPDAHKPGHTESSRHRSISKLQNTILPTDSRSMFTRAANLIMASSHLDGVLILDASVAANGQRRAHNGPESGPDAPYDSYYSRSSSSEASSTCSGPTQRRTSFSTSKSCQVLGVATREYDANTGYGTLVEHDLGRLFYECPNGRIFTFSAGGQSLSSTEEGSGSPSAPNEGLQLGAIHKRRNNGRPQRGSSAIQAMFPGARSVAFIPFWDYERSRWFAGCLCWTNNPYRLLSASVDLAYFKIFSHSIMRELSRLDAVSLNEAKTSFVASISHELRSPLHGILGTLEFIKDTPLDSFQTSMMNSLSACGTTLLDTINHVMDYSKISESRHRVSSRRLKNANTIRLSSKPLKSRRSKDAAFDFGIATEEVVEAVFSGSSYLPVSSRLTDEPQSPADEFPNPYLKRKHCFIILDVSFEEDWVYCFSVGSWRRIVMNLFGNAIKYTGSGFIEVSLRTAGPLQNTNAPTAMTLTVTDSGSGMSPMFLANHAFQPFSQENSHAPGTGLGLNIVRKIIDSSGGKIEIQSDPAKGTQLKIKLALTKPDIENKCTPERMQYLLYLPRMKGRRICILNKIIQTTSNGQAMSQPEEGLLRFITALASTLQNHLKMEVIQTTEWQGNDADIVICPELSFEYLSAIRRQRADTQRTPVTIFIAMDALEAATLRSDVRVTSRESVVEIMTQPCGPYKLAFVLNQCLDRFGRSEENIEHNSSTDLSPERSMLDVRKQEDPSSILESLHIAESVGHTPPTPPLSARTLSTTGSNTADLVSKLLNEEDVQASHILITDDNSLNRKLLVAFMRKNGLQYQEAANGLEALLAYQTCCRKFDVILMDMSMPVMDGMSATRAIREFEHERNLPRCSIIALTGLASASAKLEAWSSGIDHFMTKPINFKALAELLREEEMTRHKRKRHAGRRGVGTIQECSDLNVEDDITPGIA